VSKTIEEEDGREGRRRRRRRKQSIKYGRFSDRAEANFRGLGGGGKYEKTTTKIKEAEAAVHTRMWSPFTCCGWLLQESVFRLVEFTEIHFRNGRGS
jgi:hypothetical protein